jgi:hypothetical protein
MKKKLLFSCLFVMISGMACLMAQGTHVGCVRILVDIDSNVDYSFHSDLRLHVLRQHAQLYSP